MPVYKINNKKVEQLVLKQEGFGNEFGLRDFFADNLEEILGVRFLENEYVIPEGRIDTLGIDENNSPVIIEYKWKENEEVLSQGLYYLNWLLKNKPHFELLVKSKFGNEAEISWDQPRVILVAQGFSRYIKSAVQRVENVELKTYTLYADNILHIENEYSPLPIKERARTRPEQEGGEAIYNLDYHFNITSPEMRKIAQLLRDRILELPSVEEKAGQKSGVTYRTTKSFARFEYKADWIRLILIESNYPEDSKHIIQNISNYHIGYNGKIELKPDSDIDYIFNLIRASYNSTI